MKFRIGAVIFLSLAAQIASAAGLKFTSKCGDIPDVRRGTYCIYSHSANPKATVWFFHGISDIATSLGDVKTDVPAGGDSYADLLNGLGEVEIVVISFGKSWLMSAYPNRTSDPLDATIPVFKNKILPFIDSFKLPKPYYAVGHSMGGYNAETVCTNTPGVFAKCVLLNPMITSKQCDPYKFNFCNPGPAFLFRWAFAANRWKETAPFEMVKNATQIPESYVTACTRDGWGFYDGPYQWTQDVNARGFSAVFDPVSGKCDHDHWNTQHVLQFLGL